MLPFVEQQALADVYQGEGYDGRPATPEPPRYSAAVNLPVTRTQVPTYTCPSDSNTPSAALNGVTFHNYVANYGNTNMLMVSPLGTDTAGNPNRYGGAPFSWTWFQHDVTLDAKGIKLADIWDGTSNTLLFSETVQGKSGDLRGFAWWRSGSHFETYTTPNTASPDVLNAASSCDDRSGQPALHHQRRCSTSMRRGAASGRPTRFATGRSFVANTINPTRGGGWNHSGQGGTGAVLEAKCGRWWKRRLQHLVVPRRERRDFGGHRGGNGLAARRAPSRPAAKRFRATRTEQSFF